MAQAFFEVEKGYKLNKAVFLSGDSAPTGTDADAVSPGSYWLNTSGGELWLKFQAGAGIGNWRRIATEFYVDNATTQNQYWLDPARVRSTLLTLPTGTPGNPVVVDGVSISDGQRVLFSELSPGVNNVYVYDQATGTFSQDPFNNLEAGDTVYIELGTSAGKTYIYNGTVWVLGGQANLDEINFIRTFIGKDNLGSELPSYASTTVVVQNSNLESAIGQLDADLGQELITNTITNPTNTKAANIDALSTFTEKSLKKGTNAGIGTSLTTVDSVQAEAAEWQIKVLKSGTDYYYFKVFASHNGSGTIDTSYVLQNHAVSLPALVYAWDVVLTLGNTLNLQLRAISGTIDVKWRRVGVID